MKFSTIQSLTYVTFFAAVSFTGVLFGSALGRAQTANQAMTQASEVRKTPATEAAEPAENATTLPLNLKPQWHPIETRNEDAIETRETVFDMNGVRYDRIEYDGKQYLIRLQKSQATGADENFNCDSPARDNIPMRLAEAGVKITKRTRVFIEGLMKQCRGTREYGSRATLSPGEIAGIAIAPKDKDGNEKKIYVDPTISGAGFKSSF